MKKSSILVLFLICLSFTFPIRESLAMPPRPGLELPSTDYEEMARLGINVAKRPIRDIGKRNIYNTPGDVQPLVSGTKKFPVVCIKYPDYSNSYSAASFDSMLFSDNWSSGSAKKYYNQVSYGAFTLQGTVVGWYSSDSIKAYYRKGSGTYAHWQRAAKLAKEAAMDADAYIDYSLYDDDGDGYVDGFTCLHSWYGYEETGDTSDIHSHAWSFSSAGIGAYTTGDGVIIDDYTIDPERSSASNHGTMVSIGVFCHEWGHALGLPDLYDYTYPGEGLGNWCLMAGGSWGGNGWSPYYPVHMSAWPKMQMGWLNPTAVRIRNLYSIPDVETNSKAYWLIGRQRTFKEYFLIENRRKIRFDTLLYTQGLAIYHIDDSVNASGNWNNGGTGWAYGVALEQADGLDELYSGADRGDAGDLFPGSTFNYRFDSTATTPNSKTNYPLASPLITGSLVKNIPTSAPTVQCTLSSGVVGQFTGGPDASTYRWIDSDTTGGPSYSWIDISQTGTYLGTGDDNRYSFTLPFSFKFYGTNYTQVWVCTNGWLSFGSDQGTSAWENRTVPNSVYLPNRAVFAFWDDLDVVASDGGNMYYQVFDSTPNRYCVITWKDVRRRNSTYSFNQLTFQATLYENSNRIVLQYKDCAVGDSFSWGKSATVGIENSAGNVGLQYLYNGSPTGNLLASERAIQFYPTIVDVGVTAIEYPTGSIDSTSTPIKPRARVKNFGTDTTTFQVTMKIGSYTSSRSKKLNADAEDTVNFADWTPSPGNYTVRCSTARVNDIDFSNDTLSGSVVITVKNIGVTSIDYPIGTIDSTSTPIIPRAKVKNYGSSSETFNVTFKILGTSYNQSRSKILLAGAEDTVNFGSWTPIRGTWTTRCSVYLASDVIRSNDTLSNSVTVEVKDVGVTAIENPLGTIDSTSSLIVPRARVKNNGTNSATFNVVFKIGSNYTSPRSKTLGAGIEDTVNFLAWTPVRGTHTTRCSVYLANDVVKSNDTLSGSVTIRVKDVGVTAIEYPVGIIDSSGPIIPRARVKNFGTNDTTFDVTFNIGLTYTDTRSKTLNAGVEDTVNFFAWQPIRGTYPTRCSVYLINDVVSANDTLDSYCTIIVHDVGVFGIVQPTGIIDTAVSVIPKATVRNYGTENENFNAIFMIPGTKWTNIKPVTNLLPDSMYTVEFDPWTIEPRGNYTTKCSTYLASDMVSTNNSLNDSFIVRIKDYAVTLVSEPYNPVDSGSVTKPKAIIHNFGSTNEIDIPITLNIVGTGYLSTKNVSLFANDSVEITFDSLFANFARGNYMMRCTTQLNGDAIEQNNLATREFSVRIADVAVIEIIQPVDTIDSVAGIVPKVKVKNLGTHSENFNVIFTINEASWSSSKEVLDLDENQEQTVVFDTWEIGTRGNYTVKCSTQLNNDMYQDNDKLEGLFTVGIDTIPPEPPVLVPFNDSIYDNTPEFVWNDVIDIDTFNLVITGPGIKIFNAEFAENAEKRITSATSVFSAVKLFSELDEISFMTAETSYTLIDPLDNGTYLWKVRGRDMSGNWSVFSDSLEFTIVSPAVPILLLPLDDDTINVRTPTFVWNKSDDADSFNLVYTGPFKDETSIMTNDTMYTVIDSLVEGSYTWKVHAKDEYGNYGEFSTEWTFTVDATGPDAPTLISPINSSVINTETTTLVWSDVPDADTYHVVIEAAKVEYFTADSTLTIALGKGIYNWKVRGKDEVGNWGPYSDIETFIVTVTWVQKESMPPLNTGSKHVKDGGALVGVGSNLYAFLGTKSNKFKMYTIGTKSDWTDSDSMIFGYKYKPATGEINYAKLNKKFPGKGAALCFDGVSKIYATKGNSTNEFFVYDITSDAGWTLLKYVPTPKGLKGGTSIRYYNGKVYLLAGAQKKDALVNNFWEYNPIQDTWIALGKLPLGINNKSWKDGSSIILCDSTIYALKGGDKTNLFYAYDFDTNTWLTKEEMPIGESLYGKYKKKLLVKDGGATASDDNVIYAIKGGGTNIFWQYTPGITGVWTKLDTIPRLHKKSVPKTGAALAYADDKVWLLKGNKTPEFWCYIVGDNSKLKVPSSTANINTQEEQILKQVQGDRLLDVIPNPFTKLTTIRYTVPISGRVSLKLYNTSGRLIETLFNEYQNTGSYSLEISTWNLGISCGVYFLKYESNKNKSEIKLIVQ